MELRGTQTGAGPARFKGTVRWEGNHGEPQLRVGGLTCTASWRNRWGKIKAWRSSRELARGRWGWGQGKVWGRLFW